MQVGKECWDAVVSHLGAAGEGKASEQSEDRNTGAEGDSSRRRLVLQPAAAP